ncbi:MAG: adenine phosphoribosyltransferase [Gemmatimonadota bacterium]|nr:adenine phosphoribosyltransferase [Gemmatimonadota bacterium]
MPDYGHLAEAIRDVPDFPKPGILFKDITTLIQKAGFFSEVIDIFYERYRESGVDKVIGIEARGYLFASALAYRLKAGLVPIRKPGKLPAETVSISYELEYGTDSVEMHKDALAPDDRVLLIDDLLATGGTAEASCKLIRNQGAELVSVAFLVELDFLKGRDRLEDIDIFTIVHF